MPDLSSILAPAVVVGALLLFVSGRLDVDLIAMSVLAAEPSVLGPSGLACAEAAAVLKVRCVLFQRWNCIDTRRRIRLPVCLRHSGQEVLWPQ